MNNFMARQGDVLVKATPAPSGKLQEVPSDNDRVVLKYGEVTGHAHALKKEEITMDEAGKIVTKALTRIFKDEKGERFLKVEAPVALRHEEHKEIPLIPNWYKLPEQVDFGLSRKPQVVPD